MTATRTNPNTRRSTARDPRRGGTRRIAGIATAPAATRASTKPRVRPSSLMLDVRGNTVSRTVRVTIAANANATAAREAAMRRHPRGSGSVGAGSGGSTGTVTDRSSHADRDLSSRAPQQVVLAVVADLEAVVEQVEHVDVADQERELD